MQVCSRDQLTKSLAKCRSGAKICLRRSNDGFRVRGPNERPVWRSGVSDRSWPNAGAKPLFYKADADVQGGWLMRTVGEKRKGPEHDRAEPENRSKSEEEEKFLERGFLLRLPGRRIVRGTQ
jgi:hypothetical protein